VKVPDELYVSPIVGWRVWALRDEGDGARLASLVQRDVWTSRRAFGASCPLRGRPLTPAGRRTPAHETAPHPLCACGIHAAAELEHALAYLGDGVLDGAAEICGSVLGRVALWGDVVEGQRGWRGQRAYPVALYLPTGGLDDPYDVAFGLADYGVPVELLDCAPTAAEVRAQLGTP